MSKIKLIVARPFGGREPGDPIQVHRQAAEALLSSGKAVLPENAGKVRTSRKDRGKTISVDLTGKPVGETKEREPSERPTKTPKEAPARAPKEAPTKSPSEAVPPSGPDETKAPTDDVNARAVIAKTALATEEKGYFARKAACSDLGLETTGPDDLLIERLKAVADGGK